MVRCATRWVANAVLSALYALGSVLLGRSHVALGMRKCDAVSRNGGSGCSLCLNRGAT